VQSVAGQPFFTFMQNEIFAPLGMTDTVRDGPDVAGRPTFYFPKMNQDTGLGHQIAPPADYSCYGGAGGYVSTPSDMARFGAAMLSGDLLKPETVRMLQTSLRLENGRETGYGLGWHVKSLPFEGGRAREVGHRGSPMGGTTSLVLFPDQNIVVATTSNISHAENIERLGVRVAEVFHPDGETPGPTVSPVQ
jgi:serine beta-lactamase-like protein LACTB, mitochondrial